jgi:hypothetical protein
MRFLAVIALACVVVYASTLLASAHKCEDSGGVWVRSKLDGGWVCVKPPGKIPMESTPQ